MISTKQGILEINEDDVLLWSSCHSKKQELKFCPAWIFYVFLFGSCVSIDFLVRPWVGGMTTCVLQASKTPPRVPAIEKFAHFAGKRHFICSSWSGLFYKHGYLQMFMVRLGLGHLSISLDHLRPMHYCLSYIFFNLFISNGLDKSGISVALWLGLN